MAYRESVGALDFRFHRGGVHLPELKLWLDAHEAIGPEELAFVSHAHSDHTARHARVLFTPPTQALMRSRVSGEREEIMLEYGQRVGLPEFPDAAVTLVPAGHILGSAMILVEAGGESLLYTGDFKLRRGLAAEVCEPRKADKLIMETTFGLPKYVFPPSTEVMKGIVRFCREALDHGEIPVLLGYSLGKCQEMLCGLMDAGLPIMLHPHVAKLTAIYSRFGVNFPAYEELDPAGAATYVVLAPPGVSLVALQRNRPPLRTAMLTGWALDAGAQFQYRAGKAFPLSDHADFQDLLEFVRLVEPREVFTLHGFAAEFAATLRQQGIAAQALGAVEQMDLGFGSPSTPTPLVSPIEAVVGEASSAGLSDCDPASFGGFAQACAKIATAATKPEKSACVAAYLRTVSEGDLAIVTRWFCGTFTAPAVRQPTPLGWAALRPALCAAAGIDEAKLQQACLQYGDSAEAIATLLGAIDSSVQAHRRLRSRSVIQMAASFEELARAQSLARKRLLATNLFQQSSALEAKFLVKLFSGDLRIGLSESVLDQAVAEAFGVAVGAVARAHWLAGDLGEIACLAKSGRLGEVLLRPLRPIRPMFGADKPNPVEAARDIRRWPASSSDTGSLPGIAWLEKETGGIRCQIHKCGSSVAVYSVELKDITGALPGLVANLRRLEFDAIFEGEVSVFEDGSLVSLAKLQKRSESGQDDLFSPVDNSMRLTVFDLLWLDGAPLIDDRLVERRAWLESLAWPDTFSLSNLQRIQSADEIDEVLAPSASGSWRIRNPSGLYRAGQNIEAWLSVEEKLSPTVKTR